MEKNEQLFYDKLKDIFIGAKIEGNSGFVNLMKIKSSYFDIVFKELKKEIDEKLTEFPDFKEEMYDKLNTFFSTYFSESGSIYFTYTPLKSKIYDKIYTDQNDVILFWKTRMLYYVKTDRLWNNLTVEYDKDDVKYKIYFDVSKLEHKSANEKREVIYQLNDIKGNEISFYALYSERGRKTDLEEIRKELNKNKVYLYEDDIEKVFKIFERQNEVDYFINKDAKSFLREQFDLWLKNYVFDDESDFSEKRIRELKTLKEIAYKIIDFVSQFEDELVKIWNKPKFVLNSDYVITLDRIANKNNGIEVIKRILNHKGIDEQIKEWKELGIIDDNFRKEEIMHEGLIENLNPKYKFLPIDTKYFKDLEFDILSLFDYLDNELDGWLIHSENYQALNTIAPKFRHSVKIIYIDPPYNTDSSPIDYLNNYKDSTFLTLIKNRFDISKQFLDRDGLLITSIDDVELRYLISMLDQIFGKENYVTTISVECNPQGRVANKVSQTSEYHIIYANDIDKIDKIYVERIEDRSPSPLKRTGTNSRREERPNRYYPILIKNGIITMIKQEEFVNIYDQKNNIFRDEYIEDLRSHYESEGFTFLLPLSEQGEKLVWQRTYERVCREKDSYIVKNNTIYTPAFTKEIPKTLWKNPLYSNPEYGSEYLTNMFNRHVFDTPKSYYTLARLISMGKPGICLDYFAGSGTTAQAVMELNKESNDDEKRKYLLIENGEWFFSVIIPRIKKLCFSNKWKAGKPLDNNGISTFVKYFDLEQYEQTLRRCHYTPSEPFFNLNDKSIYEQYVFLKDPKLLDAMELDYKNNKISIKFDEIYPNIDIAETLSNLKGKWIKKIAKNSVILVDDNGDEEEIKYDSIDFKTIKPLIWW